MRKVLSLLLLFLVLCACTTKEEKKRAVKKVNFEKRYAQIKDDANLEMGSTYLPVYSHVYQMHENNNLYLTITTSMRNTSVRDTLFIYKIDYFQTNGNKIREYLKQPIYIKPLETIEIIIEQNDREGGSGANFIFDWAISDKKNPPLFEAVMISTYGQQGVSFTTKGTQIYN